jgi:predicted transcriptional regulator
MSEITPHITAAELRIMKILWAGGPQTVRQVKDALAAQGSDPPAYTTVMTMMKQLADKRALKVDREGKTFVYAPAVRRDRVLSHRLIEFLQTVFDGKAEDMVLQLAADADLSPADLRRIEAKIAKRVRAERKRGDRSSKSKGMTR